MTAARLAALVPLKTEEGFSVAPSKEIEAAGRARSASRRPEALFGTVEAKALADGADAAVCCVTTRRAEGTAAAGSADARNESARLGVASKAWKPSGIGALDGAPAIGSILPPIVDATGTEPTCARICATAGNDPDARKRATNMGQRRVCFFMRVSIVIVGMRSQDQN